ncbi:hypothetical protein [Pseudonocardia nigra]|uniref:hypothetical protein n=1 Tax=Pseudonocardia nigra TaxID=1921578 RepID=UPI001C5FE10D|nr:hypothetical protein [Pseudonocardia nigra]
MATQTRTPIASMYWGELTLLTRVGLVLALVVLPVAAGIYADVEWSATLGDPWAGIVGFILGGAVGVLIRPRRQA